MPKLERYDWPGNVRELENCIERLVIFSREGIADLKDLPEDIQIPQLAIGDAMIRIPPAGISMSQLEKQLVITALKHNQWNQTRAANFLGISRNLLIYRMQKYRLGPYRHLPEDPQADAAAEAVDEDSISTALDNLSESGSRQY